MKSYGSGSDFRQVTVPVPAPAPYLTEKSYNLQKNFGKNLAFLHSKLFTEKYL
jgi:hypothetical protein